MEATGILGVELIKFEVKPIIAKVPKINLKVLTVCLSVEKFLKNKIREIKSKKVPGNRSRYDNGSNTVKILNVVMVMI